MCVNTAEELYYKTRSTNRSISTLLCVLILLRSSSTRKGAPVGVNPSLLCVSIQQRSSSTRQGAPVGVYLPCWEYIFPVVRVNTAEELSYKTRSTSRGIPTLLSVLILQRSSSTRQGAPVGVYLPCCVCKYCRGALLQDKEHQREYIYHVVCVNTAEELFCKTRSTSRGIPTLLCVVILKRSSSTGEGA